MSNNWNLSFISEEDFVNHVNKTIEQYCESMKSYDLLKFNKNIIDPVKLLFDKAIYQISWEEMIGNEIFRQRDKSNNNDIGYFHQRIFQYIDKCTVPDNGKQDGWDVIYSNEDGIELPDGDVVHTIFVEMKNKHNTMNATSSQNTYTKMQKKLLEDDDCACFLVEAIAKKSQNIKWEITVDKKKRSHRRIRRVSIDKFYALVTGQDDAFYQMCIELPSVIEQVVKKEESNIIPHDTVVEELHRIANLSKYDSEDLSMTVAMYLLGFSSYNGFTKLTDASVDHEKEFMKRIYTIAKGIVEHYENN